VGLLVGWTLVMASCNGRTRGKLSDDAGTSGVGSGGRADGGKRDAASGGRGGNDEGAGGAPATDAAIARCERCAEESCGDLLRACRSDATCAAAFDSYARCEGHPCLKALAVAISPDGSTAPPFAQCVLAQCSLGPCPGGNPL
jgi:hypothetical protein